LLSLAQERTNTVNRNFTMADVNVAISSQLKPFEARVDSALAEIDKRIKDLKK